MADGSGGAESLSNIFNAHNMHILHWAMIGGMAVGAVALAGVSGGATLPDLGLAVIDAGWQMLTGLEHIVEVGGDVVSNTLSGDFSLDYEWGSAAHDMGGMGHAAMDHSAVPSAAAPEMSDSAKAILGMN